VVAVSVDPRRWNQACEPIEQLEGAEADAGASEKEFRLLYEDPKPELPSLSEMTPER
jgi:hypothetical protein